MPLSACSTLLSDQEPLADIYLHPPFTSLQRGTMPHTAHPDISFSPNVISPVKVDDLWQYPHADMQRISVSAQQTKELYQQFKHYQHIVIIGTGGSTLGSKMLSMFGHTLDRVLFAETIDAHSVHNILSQIKLEHTLFLVISKSGSTIETLSLYALFAQHYTPEKIAAHFAFISDPGPSPLREIANKFGATTIDHPADVGGRYSIFTVVGLLPALFADVDIDAFIDGAKHYQTGHAWQQSAAWHLDQYKAGKTITVMLPYLDRLNHYTYWWRQLWAESLGKDGYFTTPFASIGSVDQHSQLQQWLGGKADKSFTLISAVEEQSLSIDETYLPPSIYPYGAGQTTQTLQNALVQGTIHSLKQANLPVCHMHFSQFTVQELGWLVMHSLTEIPALAANLNINPFDQPAVEIGKSKAKELLGGVAPEAQIKRHP